MSARMTRISVSGAGGWAQLGRRTRKEMIAQYRAKAECDKLEAEAILSAKDEDFDVETYTGVCTRRNIIKLV